MINALARYHTLESITPIGDDPIVGPPMAAGRSTWPSRPVVVDQRHRALVHELHAT
jgi:hypothetical protein